MKYRWPKNGVTTEFDVATGKILFARFVNYRRVATWSLTPDEARALSSDLNRAVSHAETATSISVEIESPQGEFGRTECQRTKAADQDAQER